MCSIRGGVGSGAGSWFEDNTRRVVGDSRNTYFWTDNWVGGVPVGIKFPRLFEFSMNRECSVEEMAWLGWEEGGRVWVWWRRLLAWEEESVRECTALLNNIVLQDHIHDRWKWLLDPIQGYSVCGIYQFLTFADEPVDRGRVINVRHKQVSSKVSMFAWRLLRDRIPAKLNLVRRCVVQTNDNLCVGGCRYIKLTDHLFFGCNIFCSIWYLVCKWLGITSVSSSTICEHFTQFTNMAGMPQFTYFYLKVIWLVCTWVLWKERNNRVLKNMALDPYSLLEKVKLNSFLWLKTNQVSFAYGYHDWWRHPLLCMGVFL